MLCEKCGSKRDDVKKFEVTTDGINVPVLTLNPDSHEAKITFELSKHTDRVLLIFEGEDTVQVIDPDPTICEQSGLCQLYGSSHDEITSVLSRLRRQKENGMMGGLICLRYRNIEFTGNEFHALNFLVGPGPHPKVFFVDVCAIEEKDRSVQFDD